MSERNCTTCNNPYCTKPNKNDINYCCKYYKKIEKSKWIKFNSYDGDGDEVWECPECEFDLLLSEGDPWDNEYYFCPKCGADLRVKEREEI